MKTILIILSFCLSLIFQSCENSRVDFAKKWTEDIKTKILEDANRPSDSTFLDSSNFRLTTFSKGVRLKTYMFKNYPHDTIGSYFFSADQNFKIVRELCPSINRSFEAIDYKGEHVGLVEFRYCSGQIQTEGFRFGANVGVWTNYDSAGKIIHKEDYGDIEKLEKLKEIKYYR